MSRNKAPSQTTREPGNHRKVIALATAGVLTVGLTLGFALPADADATTPVTPVSSTSAVDSSTPADTTPISTPTATPTDPSSTPATSDSTPVVPAVTPTVTPAVAPIPVAAVIPDLSVDNTHQSDGDNQGGNNQQNIGSQSSGSGAGKVGGNNLPPAPVYETIVWAMPTGSAVKITDGSATYPQVGITQYKDESTEKLDVAVPATCGMQYQVDVYLQKSGDWKTGTDNTKALDTLFTSGLAGPNGAQDGTYLAGAGSNPGVAGLGNAWKFVVNAACPPTYETIVWSMPSPFNGTNATYPQVGVTQYKNEATQTLDVAVPTTCGTQYQVDAYLQTNPGTDNTAALNALFASGLAGPDGAQDGSYLAGAGSNPGVYGLGYAWKFVQNPACVPVPQACVPSSNISTAANTNGWINGESPATELPKYTVGGLESYTPGASDKVDYFDSNHSNIPLWGIDGLGYTVSGTGGAIPSYQLPIYTNGTTGFTTLVWEPRFNGGPQELSGSAVSYTGLESGQWWSTHSIPGDVGSSANNQVAVSLTSIEEANPNATIIFPGFNQGANNAGGDYWITSFEFNCATTTFPAVPTQPKPQVISTPSTPTIDCTSDTSTVITTTVTTPYVLDTATNTYVLDTKDAVTTTDAPGVSVALTASEKTHDCDMTVQPTYAINTCGSSANVTTDAVTEGINYHDVLVGNTVTTTATAAEGYTIAPGAQTVFVHTFSTSICAAVLGFTGGTIWTTGEIVGPLLVGLGLAFVIWQFLVRRRRRLNGEAV
jgi:hypothetical protein